MTSKKSIGTLEKKKEPFLKMLRRHRAYCRNGEKKRKK